MAHQIYKEKFVTLRQPAWHGLGKVIDTPLHALEAAALVQIPEIRTEEVIGKFSGIDTDCKAIIGIEKVPPSKDSAAAFDLKETVYSVVSKNYHEISHQRFLEAWDNATNSYIETLGLLYDGSTLFVTTKLPNFEVKGDEIAPYLLAVNPLRAGKTAKVRKTPVRVVCNNTLEASGKNFIAEWSIIHTQDAAIQLEKFLRNAYEQASAEYETVKEAFELLAATKLNDEAASQLFEGVYPAIPAPAGLLSRDLREDTEALTKLAAWERENSLQISHREKCLALFSGEGVGSRSEAASGSAWGAYNSVVEYEQYLKRYAQSASFLFGAGAQRVERAYDLAISASHHQ